MKNFMDDSFLLSTPSAKRLFDACKNEPIFDWHCHLSPKEIYENETPRDIAALWLGGDHYKWRAMRSCGIGEELITGGAAPFEKFKAWASCMPLLIGNPLYHWTHLELQRYFGITEPLSEKTAAKIWEQANAQIAAGGFRPRELMARSNVACVCTTDDPADTLEYHVKLRQEDFGTKILPAFRPDKALAIESPDYLPWLKKLENVYGSGIRSFAALKDALAARIAFFGELGCRATDHALYPVPFRPATDAEDSLPRTILFCLNPKDNYVLGSMLGNFQSDEAASKLQFGSGWWFNDNIDGMRAQMAALANLGTLAKFVGMVTDSRSFLSYPRHEYFRRILCDFIGRLVENGEYPADFPVLEDVVRAVSFGNAKTYFGL